MFQTINIRQRITLGFGAILVMLVVLALVANRQVDKINQNLTTINDVNSVKQRYAINFRGSVHDRAISLRDVVLGNGNADVNTSLAEIVQLTESYAKSAKPLDDIMAGKDVTPREQAILASIKETETKTLPLIAEVIKLRQAGQQDLAKSILMERAKPAFVEWLARINQFIDLEEAKNKVVGAEAREISEGFLQLIMLVCGGGLVIGGTIIWWSLRAFKPLAELTDALRRLAQGDHSITVPSLGRKTEVGVMADAVQVLKESALHAAAVDQDQAAARARRAADDERVRAQAEEAAAAEAAAMVVGSIGKGLEHLAMGDLTFRIEKTLPPAYEKLRADLNGVQDSLDTLVGSIVGRAAGIQSGTAEISQAADDLSRRTEQQAASLEETAAALDEITATVKKTAEGATHARAVVTTAREDAERSGQIVKGAVKAMAEIERSAGQISQIIGVIDEIAFQTNLLALNAGVEAARAGESGKGFAVVASEVRALAQRSADAAKEIKTLIQASGTQVAQGVDLVGQAGKALDRIVLQVQDINSVVIDIAASAHEQATGLTEVNSAINQMDQVTQQNAAMVEESTAASHALAQEADELGRLMTRFRTRSSQAAAEPAPRRAASPASAPSRKSAAVPALKVVGSRGSSLARHPAPAAAPAAEDWEEF